MNYSDGQLIVPKAGAYYIYAQLYFHSKGRVFMMKNNEAVTMVQHPNSEEGLQFTAGVFFLRAGDVISMKTRDSLKMYMFSYHTYFGAFLIQWASQKNVKSLKIVARYIM